MAERRGFEPREPLRVQQISNLSHSATLASLRQDFFTGRGCGIRTHGAVTLDGFQDRSLQPLGQPSVKRELNPRNQGLSRTALA